MSYREKGAWAELVSTLVIWGYYFTKLFDAVRSGALEQEGFAGAMGVQFVVCVILSMVVGIAMGVLVDLLSKKADRGGRDEREAWAGLRATRIAHGVLVTLIISLSGLAFVFGAFAGEALAAQANAALEVVLSNGLVLFANGALAAMILAELVHYAALIVFLRRG